MANVFKNILDSLKLTEDDDMRDYEDYVSEEEEKERRRMERQTQKQSVSQERRVSQQVQRSYNREESEQIPMAANGTPTFSDVRKERIQRVDNRQGSSKVVPIRSTAKGLEVCIMKPTRFEDSQDICDMLLSGRAAVINLEGFDVELAQRIMDFISGSVYAINGKLHQISSYIFIISPESVDISGDYLDLIKQDGFGVPTLNKEF